MGQFASITIWDLEARARQGDTAWCHLLMERRPDLLPATIIHHPLPSQTTTNAGFSFEQTLAMIEPMIAGVSLGDGTATHTAGGKSSSLDTDFFGKMKRWVQVPGGDGSATASGMATSSGASTGGTSSSASTHADQHDARDFIISVPADTVAVESALNAMSAAGAALDKDTSMDTMVRGVLPITVDLASAGATATQGVSSKRKQADYAGTKKGKGGDRMTADSMDKPAASAITGVSVQPTYYVTRVRTNVSMSPLSWAIDNVNVEMLRLFLAAPLTQINKPIAYITKDREGQRRAGDNDALPSGHSHIKFTLNAMEYALAFRVCPHIGAHDYDQDALASIFDDMMELIMTARPDFDVNHKSDVRVASSMTLPGAFGATSKKKKTGGEPLLHQAIKYHAIFSGSRPINVGESGRLMMDEDLMVHRHDQKMEQHGPDASCGLRHAHSYDELDCNVHDDERAVAFHRGQAEGPLDITRVGLREGPGKNAGKIWCSRHRQMLPLGKERKRFVAQAQMFKQETFLRRLIENEDMDLTAVEDVDGGNALHCAVIYGNLDATKWVLADPKLQQKEGAVKIVKKCLEQQDRNGYTPLHLAVRCGRFDIAAVLLQAGADYFVRVRGERAIDVVFQNRVHNTGFQALARKIDELEFAKVHQPRLAVGC